MDRNDFTNTDRKLYEKSQYFSQYFSRKNVITSCVRLFSINTSVKMTTLTMEAAVFVKNFGTFYAKNERTYNVENLGPEVIYSVQ
jgi:hypothetical protein